MGVPSGWLCWLHNSGVSTPSLFSQSKNTLGLSLNHLPISFPRPNLKPIFFPFPLSLPNLHTMSYITRHDSYLDEVDWPLLASRWILRVRTCQNQKSLFPTTT